MRLRGVCTLIALCSLLWTSGCCLDHCCRRPFHHHARCGCEGRCGCGCGCEAGYTPSCGCESAPPALAGPVIPTPASMPVSVPLPSPTPLMPGGGH